eukprot:COSAG01_NODE_2169_length_8243_cov_3.244720_9_plen_70_part_00
MELQKVGALDPGAQAVVERTKLLGFGFKGKGATAGAGRGGRVREAELSHAVFYCEMCACTHVPLASQND